GGWGDINDEGIPVNRLMAVDLLILNDKIWSLVRFVNGIAYVIGVVSYGPPDKSCGKKGSIGVYIKVLKYVKWIESYIQ
ncbi:hypothetical protein B4U79_15224, partial [Dinothrombium tinctorium]